MRSDQGPLEQAGEPEAVWMPAVAAAAVSIRYGGTHVPDKCELDSLSHSASW